MKNAYFRRITAVCAGLAMLFSLLPAAFAEDTENSAEAEETAAQFEESLPGDYAENEDSALIPAEPAVEEIITFSAAEGAIAEVSFGQSSVSAPGKITVSIYPGEYNPGFSSGCAGFAAPGVANELYVDLYAYGDGVLTGTLEIGEYTAQGEYSLSWINCSDIYGGRYYYMDVCGEIPDGLKNTFEVINPNGDNSAPEVTSFGFDRPVLAPGAYNGISAEASDLSGISTLYCNVYYDDGEYIDSFFLTKGDDGSYHARVFIPESALGRSVLIADIYAQDNEMNYRTYGEGEEPMPAGIQIAPVQCETPVIISAENTEEGVLLKWQPVPGAYAYRIYQSCDGGERSCCGECRTAEFTASGLETGREYSFSLVCITSEGRISSERSAEVSTVYYAPPVVSLGITDAGFAVQWTLQPYAASYRVFCKPEGGEWLYAGDTAGSKLRINGLEDGKTYFVTVRCLDADGNYIGTDSKPVGEVFVKAPVITSAVLEADGIKLSWNASAAAAGYRVFYREQGSAAWLTAGDSAVTDYTVKGLESGKTYEFSLRTLNEKGKCSSAAGEICRLLYIAAPVLRLKQDARKITVSWDAVNGAGGYRLFYRPVDGDWTTADVTGTEFELSGVPQGQNTVFMIRCTDASGNNYVSAYSRQVSIVFNSVPAITTVANHADYMIVSWTKIEAAVSYRLALRAGSEPWQYMDVSLQQVDRAGNPRVNLSNLTQGVGYTFAVYAVFEDGSTARSDTATQMRLVSPTVKAAAYTGYVHLEWNSVEGGSQYKIYYREKGGSWQLYAFVRKNVTSVNIKESVIQTGGMLPLLAGHSYEFAVLSATSVAGITSGFPTAPASVIYGLVG